jgi:hypothetical protein
VYLVKVYLEAAAVFESLRVVEVAKARDRPLEEQERRRAVREAGKVFVVVGKAW